MILSEEKISEEKISEEKKRKENQLSYLKLLNSLNIEEALEIFMKHDVEIVFNKKLRDFNKSAWLKLLKRKWLNKFIRIVQFNIENVEIEKERMAFKIFMICKKTNGNFSLTEIKVENNWNNNLIYKTKYTQSNY